MSKSKNNIKSYLKENFDYKLMVILSIAYGFIVFINFFKNAYFKLLGFGFKDVDFITLILKYHIYDWIVVMIFMIFVNIVTKIMFRKKTKLIFVALIHFIFSLLLGAFIFFCTVLLEVVINGLDISRINLQESVGQFVFLIDLNSLSYFTLITITYLYYYFKKVKAIEVRESELSAKLANTKLKILQSQIQPHFLFNTLNSIYTMIDMDLQKTKSLIVDLSDILREVLNQKDQNLIELQDELFILKKYINIVKIRFSDHIKFTEDIESGLEYYLTPNMLLQPLIENAIIHGITKKVKRLIVTIKISKKDDHLFFLIKNNGDLLKDDAETLLSKGNGLSNINERLKHLYGNDYKIKIYNCDDEVCVKIKIPIKVSLVTLSN